VSDSSRFPLGEATVVRRLPDALVEQIAAGEVVERPASVAKELVENALDAGATRVRVEVRGGGVELVAVSDDGCGMSPADARLALERHATSKLTGAADLARIATFGFRGEALPAIAAVARLRLRTRRAEAEEATELRVERGRLLEQRAAGAPVGTRVEAADLFGGLPARRKFLKSEATEWGHVLDWLARAALALPAVRFELRRDDREPIVWPAVGDPLERIAAVLSEREAAVLVPVARREGRAHVRGFFSRPDVHRANASGLYLFVNARPVRDRLLRHAVLEAYRDVLPRGRHPTALVLLELPSEDVDVNVHPAKWEVRFASPREVHRLVTGAVRTALSSRAWLGPPPPRGADAPLAAPAAPQAPGLGDWLFASDAPPPEPARAEPPGAAAPRFADLRLLGQLLGSYLVLEGKDGLLLVDQHAAHERVLYERLRAGLEARGVERQALLVPEVVELEAAAASALEAAAAQVARLGFELEPFDARSLAVRAIPALLAGRDPAALLRRLAADLAEAARAGGEGARRGPGEETERLLATLACHAARTAGEALEPAEQRALLEALDGIPWAPTCPHGRPLAVPFGLAEIERRFGRR
jgi:DNA mismatch repair protein MutL